MNSMADVIVNIKVMPESPSEDLGRIEKEVSIKIKEFGGHLHKVEKEPVAFGLVALKFIFISDEKKGDTEPLEMEISKISGVQSAEVIDVRRAFG